MGDNVEAHSLGKGTALSDRNNISLLDGKCGRAVGGNVLVTLFETTVLGNVMQIIPSNNNGSLHFRRYDLSGEDTSSNGNITGKGAFSVYVVSLNGGIGSLDSQTDISDVTHSLLAFGANGTLTSDKDGILLLVGLLVLCLAKKRRARQEGEKESSLVTLQHHSFSVEENSGQHIYTATSKLHLRSHSTYSLASLAILICT